MSAQLPAARPCPALPPFARRYPVAEVDCQSDCQKVTDCPGGWVVEDPFAVGGTFEIGGVCRAMVRDA